MIRSTGLRGWYRVRIAAVGVFAALCAACPQSVTVTPDGSNDGSADVIDADPASACTPGETRACYSGSPATSGIGACRAGVQSCGAAGTWVPQCLGESVPSAETCNGIDDDCDGAVDNGIDLTSDPNNCGACGNACGAGRTCAMGACGGVSTTSMTFTYVLDQMTIDPTDSPDVPHTGFDLDSQFSSDVDPQGCFHGDYFSQYDNDQHCTTNGEMCSLAPNPGCARGTPSCRGGVDNQLPTLANVIETAASVDFRAWLANGVAANRIVTILRVTAVDDLSNDSSVRVALYHAYPTFSSGCSAVASGREYAIERTSLRAGGTDVDRDAAFVLEGAIVAGRLQTSPLPSTTSFALFPPAMTMLPLMISNLYALRLRANLSGAGLSEGSIGGWTPAQEVIDYAMANAPDYVNVIRSVVGGLVDVQLAGICDGSGMSPPQYGAIASGLGFHAVPAVISTTTPVLDTPPAGSCGCGMGGC